MKKQLMIFDFVYTGIAAILLLTIAILQNCGINITHENVIGIIVLIILFVLILLSTVNVLGCNYPTSKITFLRPILLFIALYIFYCMPFMGFIGKAGNVWNSIMFAHFGITVSRQFYYISKSPIAEKFVKSPFVYTKGTEFFSSAGSFFKFLSVIIIPMTVIGIILHNHKRNQCGKHIFLTNTEQKLKSAPLIFYFKNNSIDNQIIMQYDCIDR